MKQTVSLLIFLVCVLPNKSEAQDSLNLEGRVKLLEQYNERVLQEQFATKSDQLSVSISLELEKAKQEVTDELRIIKIIGTVLGLLIAFGVGGFFAIYMRKLPKMAERLLIERLKSHLDENTNHVLQLITSQKNENRIRETKSLFVIAGSDEELSFALKLLKDMKFAKVDGEVFRYYKDLPTTDLIVLSNRDRLLPDELIIEFMSNGQENDNYIYFGGGRLPIDPTAKYAEQVNFANSKYTLYHHIINMLSFRDVMGN